MGIPLGSRPHWIHIPLGMVWAYPFTMNMRLIDYSLQGLFSGKAVSTGELSNNSCSTFVWPCSALVPLSSSWALMMHYSCCLCSIVFCLAHLEARCVAQNYTFYYDRAHHHSKTPFCSFTIKLTLHNFRLLWYLLLELCGLALGFASDYI